MIIEQQKKQRLFRFIMVLVPLLFFGATEMALRTLEYGGDLRLFRETQVNGASFYAINPEVTRRYFRAIQVRAALSTDVFAAEKGTNTCRIFCLGESSTLGYPYLYNGSFPGMMKDRLSTLWPEKNFEVINLGVTAVNSYTVADFARELMSYSPDAIVVYCGHNEFYGALGVGSTETLGRSRTLVKAYLTLESWRTFRFVRDGVGWIRNLFGGEPNADREATVMEGMVKSREILYGSSEYAAAAQNFQSNMEEIALLGAKNNVPVIFGTLVSNLNGLEPFVSAYSEVTIDAQRKHCQDLYDEAKRALDLGRYDDSKNAMESAIRIDSMPARFHFILARAFDKLGNSQEALAEYKRARDLDALRFRAPSEFNAILRTVASKTYAGLAEIERTIEESSDHGIIGNRYLLEHVHMNVEGYSLAAKAFVQALSDKDVVAPRQQWEWARNHSDAQYIDDAGVTPLDSCMASIRIWVLMKSWPFTNSGISVRAFEAKSRLEQISKACLEKSITWEKAHVTMADFYESEGRLDLAAREYYALSKYTPYNVSPVLRMGRLLLTAGKSTDAQAAFDRALEIGPTLFAYQGLGFLQLQKSRYEEAAALFWKSLEYSQGVPIQDVLETQHYLAVSLSGCGRLLEAKRLAESMVASHPEYLPGKELLQNIDRALDRKSVKLP